MGYYHSRLKFSPVYFASCLCPDFVNVFCFSFFSHCIVCSSYLPFFPHPQSCHLDIGFLPPAYFILVLLFLSFSLIRTDSSWGYLLSYQPGRFLLLWGFVTLCFVFFSCFSEVISQVFSQEINYLGNFPKKVCGKWTLLIPSIYLKVPSFCSHTGMIVWLGIIF